MVHIPVLLSEILYYLDPRPNDNFIDCTVGEGGHALAIARLTAPAGAVLALDWDPESLDIFRGRVAEQHLQDRVVSRAANFSDLLPVWREVGFPKAQGILFDLGFSSWQLERAGRGFSFQRSEMLDMRYNPKKTKITAGDIVNNYNTEALVGIFRDYGEERYARSIARQIERRRREAPIRTTDDLTTVIRSAIPRRLRKRRLHPARIFQSLRIAVNGELDNLAIGLNAVLQVISSGGKVAVISFHSLEDRIVKHTFRQWQKDKLGEILTKKPARASEEEIQRNPRARSAKLRIFNVF